MEKEEITSGFVDDILNVDSEQSFTNITEVYSSNSGFNRLSRCSRYGKLYILKSLLPEYVGNILCQQALRKEFNIGYELNHAHICGTMSWESVEGLGNCILLEYIDGTTLKEFISQGKLTPALARKFVAELCDALQYLHSKQIVHRDLKPANIMITHNGNNVKLIDFSLSDCDDYDVLKLPAGTRYYMAPEALDPKGATDYRSDIYSLGVIIGEMATALNDKTLASVSRKCTQRMPERRYSSASAVMEAIQHKPSRARWYVAASIALAIGMGIAAYLYNSQKEHIDHSLFIVYGNVSGGDACRRILRDEQIKLHNLEKENGGQPFVLSAQDSTQLMSRLKEALDAEYPLPVQKKSKDYLRQWEELKREANEVIGGR